MQVLKRAQLKGTITSAAAKRYYVPTLSGAFSIPAVNNEPNVR